MNSLYYDHVLHTSRVRTSTGDSNFNAKSYLASRYQEGCERFSGYVSRAGVFDKYYKLYCQGVLDSACAKALELGSGPALNLVVGLAPYVSSIVLTDYEENNRREVALWKENSPEAFNWHPFISAVLKEHEGLTDSEEKSTASRAEEMRHKISHIAPCDLKKEVIIDPKYVPEGGFDVVTSNQVLSIAASTMDEFSRMFKSIHSIMKSGGLFISCITAKATWYCLDPQLCSPIKYPIFYVTEDDVKRALKEAKFHVKDFSVYPLSSQSSDVKELHFFVVSKD